MTSVWFVTPAWQRFELTKVCLLQRKQVIATLEGAGIEGRCVVVADDGNLDIARSLGFDVVERPNTGPDGNVWLGRKFNDGMEYAGTHGADWIVPIGSDSWIDPAYLLPLPDPAETRTSANYCVVERSRMAELRVTDAKKAGPYLIHRDRFARGFRPAVDSRPRVIDQSTVRGLVGVVWSQRDVHPFQYIGFRGRPHMTRYERLRAAYGVRESRDPWGTLSSHYPADLVKAARAAL